MSGALWFDSRLLLQSNQSRWVGEKEIGFPSCSQDVRGHNQLVIGNIGEVLDLTRLSFHHWADRCEERKNKKGKAAQGGCVCSKQCERLDIVARNDERKISRWDRTGLKRKGKDKRVQECRDDIKACDTGSEREKIVERKVG